MDRLGKLLLTCAALLGLAFAGGAGAGCAAEGSDEEFAVESAGGDALDFSPESYRRRAVVFIDLDDELNVRVGAGADKAIVGTLPSDTNDIFVTGREAEVSGRIWVEIVEPSTDLRGWVNSFYLTEYRAPDRFCSGEGDDVVALEQRLAAAVANADREAFASVVSPIHGLSVQFLRDGRVMHYTREQASWVFVTDYEAPWGTLPGTGSTYSGPFKDTVLPSLQTVFGGGPKLACDEITLGGATYTADDAWPANAANLNFYSVHFPGSSEFDGYDWQTWLMGIDYVGGQPYVAMLIHLAWEP